MNWKNIASLFLGTYIIVHIVDYYSPIPRQFFEQCRNVAQSQQSGLSSSAENELSKLNLRIDDLRKYVEAAEERARKLKAHSTKLLTNKKKLKLALYRIARKKLEPTLKYEKHRRRLVNNIQSTWEYVRDRIPEIQKNHNETKDALTDFIKNIYQHKLLLSSDMEDLTRNDRYDKWRYRELNDLSTLVEKRFNEIQDPEDCNNQKILKCYSDTTNCGFGCQVHHITECFSLALGTKRTVLYDASKFKYGSGNFEKIFQNFTAGHCPIPYTQSETEWLESRDNEKVLMLPRSAMTNHYLRPRPGILPSGVPTDLIPRLNKLTSIHSAWWVGHINKFAFKLTPHSQELLERMIKKLNFKSPIVGVQVRRTDKKPEATYYPLEKYMVHVEEYYDQLELTQKVDKRRIYLASEVPEVIEEAYQKYPQYEVISNVEASKIANNITTRYGFWSLMGLITDLYLMSHCDFMVCTLSSNVCRIILENMQTMHPDASHLVRSLDTMYFNYGENDQYGVIVQETKETVDQGLEVGDRLRVFYQYNIKGHYYVKNLKNNRTMIMPRMAVEKIDEEAQFPPFFK